MNFTERFIESARLTHGDVYDYSKSVYVNARTKVAISCPEHGEFLQIPRKHVGGSKCPRCAAASANDHRRVTLKEFIRRAVEAHGDAYRYDSVVIGRMADKVTIVCQQHGEFAQVAMSHLNGCGCPRCWRPGKAAKSLTKYDTAWFIKRAIGTHGDKYDYDRTEYVGSTAKVTITCAEHGDFRQTARDHLNGYGCKECGLTSLHELNSDTVENFIKSAVDIHGRAYDYSSVEYVNRTTKVTIKCNSHGAFTQTPKHHLRGQGCPACSTSAGQTELYNWLLGIGEEAKQSDRQLISPRELDVVLPRHKLAIEFNGVWWHSDAFPDARLRHVRKLEAVEATGWSLFHLWETEWRDKRELVQSMILHRIGRSARLHARKLRLRELSEAEAREFFDRSHLKGHRNSALYLGLVSDSMQCVMSFCRHGDGWELMRYACAPGVGVVGGAGRLLKRFLSDVRPPYLMSYADRRYSGGSLYRNLGFTQVGVTRPNYHYLKAGRLYSRQSFQKHRLAGKLANFDPELSEVENMHAHGYRRVWDAGHYKFVMRCGDGG